MDSGARYYRCDFQVHSPRDCNWDGPRPTSAEDRGTYADRFIAACREKGLDAVAITDHHDIAFFPYIREAAAREVGQDGQPVPLHERIVVFPGMELTLAVPCQAILILDADFPLEHLPALHTVLGVSQKAAEEAMHVQTTRLADIERLDKLCDMLDRVEALPRSVHPPPERQRGRGLDDPAQRVRPPLPRDELRRGVSRRVGGPARRRQQRNRGGKEP